MPGTSLERAKTYQLTSQLLLVSDGLLADPDFDIQEHIMTIKVCGWYPKTGEDIEAMNLTTMGKRLPAGLREKIKQRYEREHKDV